MLLLKPAEKALDQDPLVPKRVRVDVLNNKEVSNGARSPSVALVTKNDRVANKPVDCVCVPPHQVKSWTDPGLPGTQGQHFPSAR